MTTISFVESATDYVECKWGLPGPYPIKIYFVKPFCNGWHKISLHHFIVKCYLLRAMHSFLKYCVRNRYYSDWIITCGMSIIIIHTSMGIFKACFRLCMPIKSWIMIITFYIVATGYLQTRRILVGLVDSSFQNGRYYLISSKENTDINTASL